jgi:hypothetical protein
MLKSSRLRSFAFLVAAVAALLASAHAALAANYWSGVSRALPTSPLGNVVALSCHNCYGDSTAETQSRVAMALARDFDLIEFDLTLHADGEVYVEHDDGELLRGTFDAALADSALKQSNRLLFLEIKENYTGATASDTLMLGVLRAVRDQGYAAAGRPVVLRSFMDSRNRHQHLVSAKNLLALAEFAAIRDHVRFHTLIEDDIRNDIRTTKNLGFHGVELGRPPLLYRRHRASDGAARKQPDSSTDPADDVRGAERGGRLVRGGPYDQNLRGIDWRIRQRRQAESREALEATRGKEPGPHCRQENERPHRVGGLRNDLLQGELTAVENQNDGHPPEGNLPDRTKVTRRDRQEGRGKTDQPAHPLVQ